MRLRVAHLSNYYKSLERDLEEIQTLQKNIHRDRSYSRALAESLQKEAERISALLTKICSQLIKDLPAFLLEELGGERTKAIGALGPKQKISERAEKTEAYAWPQEPVISLPSSPRTLNKSETLESEKVKDFSHAKRSEKKQKRIDKEQGLSEKIPEIKEEKSSASEATKIGFPFVFKKD